MKLIFNNDFFLLIAKKDNKEYTLLYDDYAEAIKDLSVYFKANYTCDLFNIVLLRSPERIELEVNELNWKEISKDISSLISGISGSTPEQKLKLPDFVEFLFKTKKILAILTALATIVIFLILW